jgi:hypothetical protein
MVDDTRFEIEVLSWLVTRERHISDNYLPGESLPEGMPKMP